MILAIDLGTTNWKAALITPRGELAAQAHIPTPVIREEGHPCYAARDVLPRLREVLAQLPPDKLTQVTLIAFTGMAEAGVLLDRSTGELLSNVWPWFDRRALPLYEKTRSDPRFAGRPAATGLPDSYKYGIYKLLTLLERVKHDPASVRWVGLVAYAASLLTGECAEDVSIAARTGCVALRTGEWDAPFLASLGLSEANFPRLIPQGGEAGRLARPLCGIPAGVPVCLGGHDHVCAAYAAGALQSGGAFLSTGTAQVVLGPSACPETSSCLSYGPSPAGLPYTCLGSIQSAGGSVNFWKERLYPGEDFAALLEEAGAAPSPSGLLYFPYLAGSGAPHLDPGACGALIGLRDGTTRGAIIAAVYEGIALETRYLAETMGLPAGTTLFCMGGLTRHRRYMQVLANVLGARVQVPDMDEGTLYGAARLALDRQAGASLPALTASAVYEPDTAAHEYWTTLYHRRYLPLMHITKAEGQ